MLNNPTTGIFYKFKPPTFKHQGSQSISLNKRKSGLSCCIDVWLPQQLQLQSQYPLHVEQYKVDVLESTSLESNPRHDLVDWFFVASCLYCFLGWTTCQQNMHHPTDHVSLVSTFVFFGGKKISSLQLTNVKECFTCHLHLHLHHHHHQNLGISSWKTLWTDCKTIQHPLLQNCLGRVLKNVLTASAGQIQDSQVTFHSIHKTWAWRYPNLDITEKSCSKKGTVDFTRKLRFVGLSTGFKQAKRSQGHR